MAIARIPRFDPVIGDDLPYHSIVYRDVPEGFRISDLEPLTGCPLSAQYWQRLTGYADLHFRNHEIIGKTFVDFFENLRDSYLMNADTLEKALEVYYDDIAKPTQSRTIKRTHEETETLPESETTRSTQYGHKVQTDGTANGSTTDIEYAIEGTDSTPSTKSENSSTANDTETHSGTDTETETMKGGTRKLETIDKEDWSDVGVAPNYELMNGFLDNNRTMENIFISFFNDCFTIKEGLIW